MRLSLNVELELRAVRDALWCTLLLLTLCFITVYVAAGARALSPIACLARRSEHNPLTQGELLISQERDVLGSAGFTRGQTLNDIRGLLRIGLCVCVFCRAVWVKWRLYIMCFGLHGRAWCDSQGKTKKRSLLRTEAEDAMQALKPRPLPNPLTCCSPFKTNTRERAPTWGACGCGCELLTSACFPAEHPFYSGNYPR